MTRQIFLSDKEARYWRHLLADDPTAPPPDAATVAHAQARSRSAHSGKRADLGDRYFRSSWESNFARYFNWLGLRWEYEPRTFEFTAIKRGTRFYTPDFQVWGWDARPYVWIEIKGYMDAVSRTKLDRMARYYPGEPLILVDADAYHAVRKELCRVIPDWETY